MTQYSLLNLQTQTKEGDLIRIQGEGGAHVPRSQVTEDKCCADPDCRTQPGSHETEFHDPKPTFLRSTKVKVKSCPTVYGSVHYLMDLPREALMVTHTSV